ncbi:MAG: ferrous iron transport protein B [Bacteroidota bacterium]|nr:ferrous iron transport protein B [Bacteroidota bacterium]
MSRTKHIALVGNPNSGKSTLFNILTGLNQKISNLPGTTIDKKTGKFLINDLQITITDLPGTYSIYPKGEDENIAVKHLLDNLNETVDLVIYVADASNLQRNLLLFTQIADLNKPTVLALNMMDVAEDKGIYIDLEKLSLELGVLIIPLNSREKKGIEQLKNVIYKTETSYQKNYSDLLTHQTVPYHQLVIDRINNIANFSEDSFNEITQETEQRHQIIQEIVNQCQQNNVQKIKNKTKQIDKILLHPVYGFLVFFLTLFVIFQFIFKFAEYPMSWIEYFFSFLAEGVNHLIPAGTINSLITEGVIPGISGVVVFLPQIVFLFMFLSILEESGYMTRVSFINDRLMRQFGLNGKSIVPLIGGMACAIPSIMAARNIENKKDRLITILVTPLMGCSARLPVYTLLVSLLIKNNKQFIDIRGLILLGLYLAGFIAVLLFSLLFKYILQQKEKSFFILEMPDYRLPSLRNVAITIKNKTYDFVFNAGKIILMVSIVLWFLASYGPSDKFESIELKYSNYQYEDKESLMKSEKLEASYAGIMGKAIEPAIRPLGYDWKIGIALITSFAAREIFVGTIATIYSIKDVDDEKSISDVLAQQYRADKITPVYNLATIVSLLLFYAFAMQCMSTLAITYRETRSIKWPIVQFVYMTGFAYLMSFFAYQILS